MYYTELDNKIKELENQYLGGGISFYEYLRNFANAQLEALHSDSFQDYKLGLLDEMLSDIGGESSGDDTKALMLSEMLKYHTDYFL